MSPFSLVFRQTLKLAFRKGGGAFGACAFYVIIVTLFTFALGAQVMAEHASAVLCVAMLLSIITSLPLLFERDHEDGTLEQYLLQPTPLEWLVAAKIAGQWCAQMLPILLVSPLLALTANLSATQTLEALRMLLLASPTLVCLGAVGAALTLGSKRGGLLQALIVMPLYIPVLIFASGGAGGILFLAAMGCASVPLGVIVCAALVRLSQD
jgi:heme exporter protein B